MYWAGYSSKNEEEKKGKEERKKRASANDRVNKMW